MFRPRRRHRYGAQICAFISAVLLLLSVSLLHSRLNFFQSHSDRSNSHALSQYDAESLTDNPLIDDPVDPLDRSSNSDDLIDELDDGNLIANNNNVDEFFIGESEDELDEEDNAVVSEQGNKASSSLYYYDHLNGVVRSGFNRKSIEEWEDYISFESKLRSELGFSNEGFRAVFGSDDIPVDEKVRTRLTQIGSIEDALLLKGSKLREGWGEWFDRKGDFLRRDRMFKSNWEALNPINNPMLQDPDGPCFTGLTRGDKLVQKGLQSEFKKVPFLVKKPLAVEDSKSFVGNEDVDSGRIGMKRIKRKTLENDSTSGSWKNDDKNIDDGTYVSRKIDDNVDLKLTRGNTGNSKWGNNRKEFQGLLYADGRRWGYFPGLSSRLSFNNFMDAFFRKGKCSMRFFMVWNSPPWMFSVRHQRGLESVLFHYPDACVVVFSETLELNFFNSSFVKDGFKVAVVMPNLDELLKSTPTHVFASVWNEWKRTKFYPTHYSELIRLAALYKYGGVYLDSDIIVLKPLSSLSSALGMDEEPNDNNLNGAVMVFRKHSPFIYECLREFYASYDDNLLRWNGAELLGRVHQNVSNNNVVNKRMVVNLQPPFIFFPINRKDISRYFAAPETPTERAEQDFLLNKILTKSVTFHFWNSITSALIPEPDSLVARLINHPCIHCSDVL